MQYTRKQIEYMVMIGFSGLIMGLFSVFAYREIFPEYKIYQKRYMQLEETKAQILSQDTPPFKSRIKQIVMQDAPGRAPRIDRCTSCHVALDLPHFSPTRIKKDINGENVHHLDGSFAQEANPDYIWTLFDKERDQITVDLQQTTLNAEERKTLLDRLSALESLETVRLGGKYAKEIDMRALMKMHPLFKGEERPFQQHPIEEFGCTICHSGNGRALTTARAHGPALDGEYEAHEHGHTPQFQESDGVNDPLIAKMYNAKPGHELLFQTTPLYLGAAVQASCAQCHQSGSEKLHEIYSEKSALEKKQEEERALVKSEIERQKSALISLLEMHLDLKMLGYDKLTSSLHQRLANGQVAKHQKSAISSQLAFLQRLQEKYQELTALDDSVAYTTYLLEQVETEIRSITGFGGARRLLQQAQRDERSIPNVVDSYFEQLTQETNSDVQWKREEASVRVFDSSDTSSEGKMAGTQDFQNHQGSKSDHNALITSETIFTEKHHVLAGNPSNEKTPAASPLKEWLRKNKKFASSTETNELADKSPLDAMMDHYARGKSLFVSQSCYACHKVELFSKGAVGPELTEIGDNYPWYVKESIVWPQADLASSVMPNFRLDHEEVADLMTYLMALKGQKSHTSTVEQRIAKKRWESGQILQSWEKPLKGSDRFNLDLGYEIFAQEGCASCHRLLGYDSAVKISPQAHEWFRENFKQQMAGRDLLETLVRHGQALLIHQETSGGSGRIEKMIAKDPSNWDLFASYHSSYKFVKRALEGEGLEMPVADKKMLLEALDVYLKLYISEYGLGRQIGPHLHYSGVYRSKDWLYKHFLRPGDYVAKSIMPAMPFDPSKFELLTNFLIALGQENNHRDKPFMREGFDPEKAYDQYCAHCHGEQRLGNGPIAEWIYPIPKNLRSGTFLQGLSREQAIESITNGVPGTPMAPWNHAYEGRDPVLSKEEIAEMVDWLIEQVPQVHMDNLENGSVTKWQYSPEDVQQELLRDRDFLRFLEKEQQKKSAPLKGKIWKKSGFSLGLPINLSLFSSMSSFQGLFSSSALSQHSSSPDDEEILQEAVKKTVNEGVREENQKTDATVLTTEIFEKREKGYFLKKHFFTEDNIAKGKALFIENCAHCHGLMGAGDGLRAVTMKEAKPRMLIHLPWISNRDDMRLLRGIKYGVAGTSMISFADVTTAWQRIQLVGYIRSLTDEKVDLNEKIETLRNKFKTFYDVARDWEREQSDKTSSEKSMHLQSLVDLHAEQAAIYEEFFRGKDHLIPFDLESAEPFIQMHSSRETEKGAESIRLANQTIVLLVTPVLTQLQQTVENAMFVGTSALKELENKEKAWKGKLASQERREALSELALEKEEIMQYQRTLGQLLTNIRANSTKIKAIFSKLQRTQ